MNKKKITVIALIMVMLLGMLFNCVSATSALNVNKPQLNKLEIEGRRKLNIDEKLKLNIETTGDVYFTTVLIKNKNVSSQNVLISVQDGYVDFSRRGSQKIYEGENYIDAIFFNSNGQGQSVWYSLDGRNDSIKMNYDTTFTLTIGEKPTLTKMYIDGNTTLTKNDKLNLKIETTGDVNFVTVGIKNKNVESQNILIKVGEDGIDLSKLGSQKIYDGENYIDSVFLNPSTEGVYTWYSLEGRSDSQKLDFNVSFTLTNGNSGTTSGATNPIDVTTEKANIVLSSVSLDKTEAKLNDKIKVNLVTDKKIVSASLIFKGTTADSEESMMVNLKDLNGNPYFVVPFTTSAGDYELNYIILKDADGNEAQYRKGEEYYSIKHFDFDSVLKIKNEVTDGNLLDLDNDKITDEVINKIKALDSNIVIGINASNNNPTIDQKLFEAIQKTDKTIIVRYQDIEWVFNGLNITNPKSINIATTLCNANIEKDLNNVIKRGLAVIFPSNGQLPGKCQMKIYNTGVVGEIMKKQNANIYFYNEATRKYEVIDLNTKLQEDGYYEFYIDHNSTYVLTTDKIDDQYIETKAENQNVVSANSKEIQDAENAIIISQQVAIILAVVIGCIVILAIVCIVASFVSKGKKDKK